MVAVSLLALCFSKYFSPHALIPTRLLDLGSGSEAGQRVGSHCQVYVHYHILCS